MANGTLSQALDQVRRRGSDYGERERERDLQQRIATLTRTVDDLEGEVRLRWRACTDAAGEHCDRHDLDAAADLLLKVPAVAPAYRRVLRALNSERAALRELEQELADALAARERGRANAAAAVEAAEQALRDAVPEICARLEDHAEALEAVASLFESGLAADLADLDRSEAERLATATEPARAAWRAAKKIDGAIAAHYARLSGAGEDVVRLRQVAEAARRGGAIPPVRADLEAEAAEQRERAEAEYAARRERERAELRRELEAAEHDGRPVVAAVDGDGGEPVADLVIDDRTERD